MQLVIDMIINIAGDAVVSDILGVHMYVDGAQCDEYQQFHDAFFNPSLVMIPKEAEIEDDSDKNIDSGSVLGNSDEVRDLGDAVKAHSEDSQQGSGT